MNKLRTVSKTTALRLSNARFIPIVSRLAYTYIHNSTVGSDFCRVQKLSTFALVSTNCVYQIIVMVVNEKSSRCRMRMRVHAWP